MDRFPFLIEAPMPGEEYLQVCARVRELLQEQGVAPLPLASSLERALQLRENLRAQEAAPAVFVVNTYQAKEIIPNLDELMGETPVIFMRRGLLAGHSGLNKHVPLHSGLASTEVMIGKMQPRLTSIWYYWKRNVDQVAKRASQSILRFFQDDSFRHIEAAARE